jgi:hypothetical protein
MIEKKVISGCKKRKYSRIDFKIRMQKIFKNILQDLECRRTGE